MFQVWKYWLSPFASMCGPTWRAASPPVVRVLDLDHLGAEVGEQHRAVGPGAELLEGEHADAVERLHALLLRLIHCLAMIMRCISLVPSPMQVSGASR